MEKKNLLQGPAFDFISYGLVIAVAFYFFNPWKTPSDFVRSGEWETKADYEPTNFPGCRIQYRGWKWDLEARAIKGLNGKNSFNYSVNIYGNFILGGQSNWNEISEIAEISVGFRNKYWVHDDTDDGYLRLADDEDDFFGITLSRSKMLSFLQDLNQNPIITLEYKRSKNLQDNLIASFSSKGLTGALYTFRDCINRL